MINWNFNPEEYTERSFALIPEGNHRVTIINIYRKEIARKELLVILS